VRTTGKLYCWGINTAGKLGDGSETQRHVPKQIGTSTDWRSISASRYQHTCGIRGSGNLYCWGHNSFGQIGDGSTTKRTSPKRIGTFSDWTAVSPGSSHTCGVRKNGKLYCWGQNTYGQAGIGAASSEKVLTPARVGEFLDWVGVGSGYAHSCGVRANGKLYCWGKSEEGQIGDGTTLTHRPSPTRAGDLGWSKVASGDNHNCGIRNGGELYCWGDNGSGEVGGGPAPNPQTTPLWI
jgi:alpha-tubulin suppressor-like RCC1 family protein